MERSFTVRPESIENAAAVQATDFVFVVGGREYGCTRFQACLISAKVCDMMASDACFSRFVLKVDDKDEQFGNIMSLMKGHAISITPSNKAFLKECARELRNHDLLGEIVGYELDQQEIALSNVVERIKTKHEFHKPCTPEIEFLAQHFFEAELEVFKSLSVSDLELVVSSKSLKLYTEDQLLDTLLELGADHNPLLRYVQFVFLSKEKLQAYLEYAFDNELVDSTVWGTLCKCVFGFCESCEQLKPSIEEHAHKHITKEFKTKNGQFGVIFQYFRDSCGGNPDEKGTIAVTGSSSEHNEVRQILDNDWTDWWGSKPEENSCVQFDFKSRRIRLIAYTIKSDGNNGQHLVSWVIEVSEDGETWEPVDERPDTKDLDGTGKVETFECNKPSEKFVQFVRLRQTGPNSSATHHLLLTKIEFFGQINDF